MNLNDERLLGKFWPQQRKVYNLYRYRRAQGDEIDSNWFKDTMDRICKKDIPEGYDPKVNKFRNHWKDNFCHRWKISFQVKTNKKAKSIHERIHLIKNYHYYVIYLLGKKKPGRKQ